MHGHRPVARALPSVWLIEGKLLAGAEPALSRLRIDARSGTILERGAIDGTPHVVLDEHEILLPGFLDIHVHCRDDPSEQETYKEDFGTASRAALHGGVVLLGDMPNNPRPPIDRESYAAKRARARRSALVDVVLYAGVSPKGTLAGVPAPYKCYFGPSIGDLNLPAGADAAALLAPYRGQLVAFHAEAAEVLARCRAAPTHEARRPPEAEATAIAEIARIACALGLRPHIAHLSSAAGLEEVRKARREGVSMSCEVAPHHLFFDDQNRATFARGAWLQMNPPLRTSADREALLSAFARGEIEILATDHAPHSIAENERGISGVPLLDTFGAFLTWLYAEGISWATLAARAAAAPARLFAPFIDGRLGGLDPGGVASFSVIDPSRPWRVDARDLSTRAAWSPFEGFEFPGRVTRTAVRGRLYEMQ
ncbi:MAG: amidohydrolase family protein [Planctomycetes bacterium]|nr:amidohydrolase family protein [Planctomycetota bacterium]